LGQSLIPRPVFLLGCARSGTSILGEALAAHPRVAYLFEASAIWNEIVPPRPDHRLTAADAGGDLAREIYRALAAARDALLVASAPGARPRDAGAPAPDVLLEKNPKHVIRIPFLAALFPHGKFIHILRDGRDTVCSLMFRNRGPRWGHLEIPGWKELLAAFPRKNHVRCAHQWRDSVTIARADARALPAGRYVEVRYEDLLAEPAATARGLLEFMGLDPHPHVDAFLPKIQDATEGSYHAKRQVRHYVENHSRRVGRYEENLTAEELEEVEEVCGALLRELGYPPSM
jgi:hypothetical protein